MRTRRYPKPGREIPRHGGTTQPVRRLQHEHALAATRQIRGAYQPIMATADDNAVVS
jgi:hypothetical protein